MKGQIFISIDSNLEEKDFYFELVNALLGMKNKDALNSFNILSIYSMKQKTHEGAEYTN